MLLMAISLFAPAIMREASAKSSAQVDARLVKRIRHELATLPYYGVYDWLEFEVRPDNTVILREMRSRMNPQLSTVCDN